MTFKGVFVNRKTWWGASCMLISFPRTIFCYACKLTSCEGLVHKDHEITFSLLAENISKGSTKLFKRHEWYLLMLGLFFPFVKY